MQEIPRFYEVVSIAEANDHHNVEESTKLLEKAQAEYDSYKENIPPDLYDKDETLLHLDDVIKALQICLSEAEIREEFNKELEVKGVETITEELFDAFKKLDCTRSKELYVIVDGKATVSAAFTIILKMAMLKGKAKAA